MFYNYCLSSDCSMFVQTMWKIMYNYHQIKNWHGARDDIEKSSENSPDAEDSFSRHYVKTKLENGLLRVWRVRTKTCPFFLLPSGDLYVAVATCKLLLCRQLLMKDLHVLVPLYQSIACCSVSFPHNMKECLDSGSTLCMKLRACQYQSS